MTRLRALLAWLRPTKEEAERLAQIKFPCC